MGFSIPLASWMRNELRPWVEYNIDFINKDKGPWDKKMVNQLWLEHMNGQRDRTEQLWAIIMLGNFVLKSPMGDQ
jgi:asparagine synthase (glutamine-hydrolysing)